VLRNGVEIYVVKEEPGRGIPLPNELTVVAERTGPQTWLVELFRRKRLLLLHQSSADEIEACSCFAPAVALAEAQCARALLLRALCDHLRIATPVKQDRARTALAALCDSLTEGHDCEDVVAARRLVEDFE
jgi:predicted ATPase